MNKQTNILSGPLTLNAGVALTDKELYLAALADGGATQSEVILPNGAATVCQFLVEEGGAVDTDIRVRPLVEGEQLRAVAKSTGDNGAILVLADPGTPADKGKVRVLPATEGVYWSPGLAEEDFVDGQLVRFRVQPRLIYVGAAFSSAAPAATAPTNSSPYGYSQAQAQAILTNLIELRAFAVAMGWKATS